VPNHVSRLILPLGSLALVAAVAIATLRLPAVIITTDEVRGQGPIPVEETTVQVQVAPGTSSAAIGRQMERAGVIDDGGLFATLTALMGLQGRLAAGTYEFGRGVPVADAVRRVRAGVTVPAVTVTIPEGKRLEEVAAILERQGVVSAADFLAAARGEPPQAAARDRPAGSTLEGYLFPDTYFFTKHATAQEVVQRLRATFEERLSPELYAAIQAQGLTLHEAVTLASIVEREAQVPEERPLIAAVFLNRLRAGMPLQADPTVQYALAADAASVQRYGWWKRDLTVEDLKIDSSYNTYVRSGLPPGPICNPGLAALRAVAYPAPVRYLYFVAKGDGTHAFAETLEEHNRNVARYQR
jgi:UPF0755 protein